MMNVVLYRAVKPAAKLMDHLRFPQKLLVMALVFLVPMLVVSSLLLKAKTESIDFTRMEVRGAHVMPALSQLQRALQDHRGVSTLLLTHSGGSPGDLAQAAARVDAALVGVEAWRSGDGHSFAALDDQWKAIVADWNQLKSPGAPQSPDGSFDAHSHLVEKITTYIGAIADASNLTLDPDMTSYALQDFVTVKAPDAMQRIGTFRNYASSHLASGGVMSPLALGQIMMRESAMDTSFDPIAPGLQRAMSADPAVAAALSDKLRAAAQAKSALKQLVDEKIVNAAKVQATPAEVFEAGAQAKAALEALDLAAIPQLERLLETRLAQADRDRVIAVVACSAATLIALYLFFGFMRSLNATLRGLRRAAVKMTHNEFPEEIELFSTDEMQEIADEMEKISQAFMAFSQEQKKQLDDATKRVTALHSASVGLVIADADGHIEYLNQSARDMFARATDAVRKIDEGFDADKLVGRSFDLFHRNPAHQKNLLASLKEPFHSRVRIGPGIYDIAVTPVFSPSGERLGAVAEWLDRTAQEAMDKRVADIVIAAADGDFSKRVALDGLDENFRRRAENLNQLIETVDAGLSELERVMSAVADGDLTQSITREFKGQFGKLSAHTNTTVSQLSQIVGQIKVAAESVKVASREIASGNNDLSGRTEQQAAHIEETASSMEELTSTVKRNADNAQQASQLSRGASDVAVKGGELVSQVVTNMTAIEESSRKVADIVGVIDGIAFQTNILALNAAVEAARAGDQGRGFAVVAGEVRSLAQRAAAAAKEIKALITDSVEKVGQGSGLVGNAGKTMGEIVNSIKRVTDIMSEISSASREQSSGIETVNSAITQMDESTQQNAALVEQASASARSLEEQAMSLATAVSVFRTQVDGRRAGPARQPGRPESPKAEPVTATQPAPARPLVPAAGAKAPVAADKRAGAAATQPAAPAAPAKAPVKAPLKAPAKAAAPGKAATTVTTAAPETTARKRPAPPAPAKRPAGSGETAPVMDDKSWQEF